MNLITFLRELDAERRHVEQGRHTDVAIVALDPDGCHVAQIDGVAFTHTDGKLTTVVLKTSHPTRATASQRRIDA